jgi:hypothetical protein
MAWLAARLFATLTSGLTVTTLYPSLDDSAGLSVSLAKFKSGLDVKSPSRAALVCISLRWRAR